MLAIVSTTALGFQEQQGAAPSAAPSTVEKAAPSGATAGQLIGDSAQAPKTESGREVRIPGLGKLGVLPKMDFGLELLYGATEGKQQLDSSGRPAGPAAADDLSIRGTLKHRF